MPYSDPEKARARARRYYAANRERILLRNRAWHIANPEAGRAHRGAWQRRNRARARGYHQRWYARNREYNIARALRWFEANPDARRAAWARNKKARRNAAGRFSGGDIRRILIEQGGGCLYCRAPLASGFEIDHVVPLSRGGTHWPANIALACRACNRAKHARLDWSPGCRLTA